MREEKRNIRIAGDG